MPEEAEPLQSHAPQQNRVLQFFSHPAVGIIGSIASVIGVVLAILFYLQTLQTRELVYTVHPVQSTLAQAGTTEDLQIVFKGEIVTRADVVAIQFAFWNQGKMSIRPINLLSPVEIKLNPPAPVLKVSINKVSRDIIELNIPDDKSIWQQGRIPLSWKILERYDGGSLQIIYAGAPATSIEMAGIIEDQGRPHNLRPRLNVKSPTQQFEEAIISPKNIIIIITIFTFVLIYFFIKDSNKRKKLKDFIKWLFLFILLLTLISLVAFLFGGDIIIPPFGF